MIVITVVSVVICALLAREAVARLRYQRRVLRRLQSLKRRS